MIKKKMYKEPPRLELMIFDEEEIIIASTYAAESMDKMMKNNDVDRTTTVVNVVRPEMVQDDK
jgi:hypothetical protein